MMCNPNTVAALDTVAALTFSHDSVLQVVAHEKQPRIAGRCVEHSKSICSYASTLCKGKIQAILRYAECE
jgi:hypothetical protein